MPGPGLAAEPAGNRAPLPPPAQPVNFDEAVRIALHQSPVFIKSAVEIEIRKLDEADRRWGMVPPFTFRSYYYFNQPTPAFGLHAKPYVLYFTSNPYNPLGSYFALQAQKLATQAAIYNHMGEISKGIRTIGSLYLEMNNLAQMAAYQTDIINLAQDKVNFVENRVHLGTASTLDLRVAEQELTVAKEEAKRIAAGRKKAAETLKSYLGYRSGQELQFDLRDVRHQVLNDFSPEAASLEQAKTRSMELKILEIRSKLQEYNIRLAKTKLLPTISVNAQTPDPLSLTSGTGLYAGLGVEVPVWDGFTRFRNVSRQKAILQQENAEKETREINLEEKFWRGKQLIADLAAAKTFARSQEELARLRERQAEIHYQSGGEPLVTLLEARKAVLEAKKNITAKNLDYDKAVLEFYELTGDLSHTYVDAKSGNR